MAQGADAVVVGVRLGPVYGHRLLVRPLLVVLQTLPRLGRQVVLQEQAQEELKDFVLLRPFVLSNQGGRVGAAAEAQVFGRA